MDGWNTTFSFPFGFWPIFRGELAVSFRDGLSFSFHSTSKYHGFELLERTTANQELKSAKERWEELKLGKVQLGRFHDIGGFIWNMIKVHLGLSPSQ